MARELHPKIAELFLKNPEAINPSLERMQRAYEHLGKPASGIPCVLIGGTNGKGSTAGFLWHLLSASGLRVGLYTSPHLVFFRERFQLSDRDVTDEELVASLDILKARLPLSLYDSLSFFEVTTLLAFQLFADEENDFNIYEVGLGGRWDATNVCDPAAVAITSVAMDHQEYLGNDLAGIAYEKAGIIRAERPVFLGDGVRSNPATFAVMQKEISAKKACLMPIDFEVAASMPYFAEKPAYLKHNFAIASALFSWLRQTHFSADLRLPIASLFPKAGVRQSLSLMGRFQRATIEIGEGRIQNLLFDVCHNPEGAMNFSSSLRAEYKQPLPALVSILADKDVNGILDLLKGILHPIVLFKSNNVRTLQPSMLAGRHHDLKVHESFKAAWSEAVAHWPPTSDKPWVVCGSVRAVGEVIDFFSAYPNAKANANHPGGDLPLHGRSPLDLV